MLVDLLLFALGITLLVGGAWMLVHGGSRIAELLGVSPVIVGLTIVAWGTSAPELCVSLIAALRGSTELMLGNVIGSNVANIGLILGLAVMLMRVASERRVARRDGSVLLASSLLFWVFLWDRHLARWEGGVLLTIFVAHTMWLLYTAADERVRREDRHVTGHAREMATNAGLVLLGIGGLAGGGEFIVRSAVKIATSLGASEGLIGLTLVAVGTSLPELATTIVAAAKRESGLVVGNVIGSNLFNTLAVAGPVALLRPVVGKSSLEFQLHGMLAFTAVFVGLLLLSRGKWLGRIWGIVLTAGYAAAMIVWIANGV